MIKESKTTLELQDRLNKKVNPCRKNQGFTLIEVLIVVVIVAILASAVYSLFQWSAYSEANDCSKTGQKETYFNGEYLVNEYEWYCTKTDEYIWR